MQDQKVCSWQMVVLVSVFLVSLLELAAEVGSAGVARVHVEDARSVQDERLTCRKISSR